MPIRSIYSSTLGYLLALLCLSVPALSSSERATHEVLPRPASLEPAVKFWTRVYTQVDSQAGYVHDSRNLRVVYATLNFRAGSSPRDQDRTIAETLSRYRRALLALAKGKGRAGDAYQRKALDAWGSDAGARTLARAAKNLRFQRGQSDRFRSGIERAGAWEGFIRATLKENGLPEALVALPHVESSYNPTVRSHAGAAGLWQLTELTGKRFLEISEVLDERLDPYRATEAAARFLLQNYSVLKSWPLAITAYNHGMSGVRRAVRTTGNRDIGTIVHRYKGPRFGFASRNFYAAFLAAVDVASNPDRYFGPLERRAPEDTHRVELPAYFPVAVLSRELDLEPDTLRALNPVLGPAVWTGQKFVPKGYRLLLPPERAALQEAEWLQCIAPREGFAAQRPDQHYRVKPGDTLSAIALRYATDISILMVMNDLSDSAMIRAGSVLRLPSAPEPLPAGLSEKDERDSTVRVAARSSAEPATAAEDEGTLPVEPAPGIGADPGDYVVAEDDTIEVALGETLGHYAEWLETHSSEIRQLNRRRKGQPITMGDRIRLAFPKVSPAVFQARRVAYHEQLQSDYFERHRIVGSCSHVLSKGDSLWQIANQTYGIPLWLLRQYNPDVDPKAVLSQGVRLAVPLVAPVGDSSGEAGEEQSFGPVSCPGASSPVVSKESAAIPAEG